jgi:hypothetical protein
MKKVVSLLVTILAFNTDITIYAMQQQITGYLEIMPPEILETIFQVNYPKTISQQELPVKLCHPVNYKLRNNLIRIVDDTWKALFLTNKLFNQIITQALVSITPPVIQKLTYLIGTTPYDIANIFKNYDYIEYNREILKALYAMYFDNTISPNFNAK